MKHFILLLAIIALPVSCKNSDNLQVGDTPGITGDEYIEVADNIIYDVVIKVPNQDDPWEVEKLAGYRGDEMVNALFDAVYSGKVKVTDYHSGKNLSTKNLEKLEQEPGFERENIGKIQFTEKWHFNRSSLEIEKEVISLVIGYENRDPADGTLIGYIAAFKMDFR